MKEHEFRSEVYPNCFCLHCGALFSGRENTTCVERVVGLRDLRPEPKLREMALDSVDSIFDRIQELKKEKDSMINHVDEMGAMRGHRTPRTAGRRPRGSFQGQPPVPVAQTTRANYILEAVAQVIPTASTALMLHRPL